MAIYRLKPCGADCPENFEKSACEDFRGCVESVDSYLFTTITRYWIGPNALYDGEPVSKGDLIDISVYSPPGEIDGVYQFSKVTVHTHLGFEPENEGDEPEGVEHDGASGAYDNYYGCIPDPNNENRNIKFQQPGYHIMNGYLTETSIVDNEVIVATYFKLVLS